MSPRRLPNPVGHNRNWLFLVMLILLLNGAAYAGIASSISRASNATAAATQVSIQLNNRIWCHALRILTANPVPKPANPKSDPSRETSYESYDALVTLRKEFGCE